VVLDDVPDGCIAVGIPAQVRPRRRRFPSPDTPCPPSAPVPVSRGA
jgi:serine acetyltransferase